MIHLLPRSFAAHRSWRLSASLALLGAAVACTPARRPVPYVPPAPAPLLSATLDLGYRGWARPAGDEQALAALADVRLERGPLRVAARGALPLDQAPTRLLEGRLAALIAAPRVLGLHADLFGELDRDPYDHTAAASQLGVRARVWAARQAGGVWVEGGGMRPWDHTVTLGGREASAGLWTQLRGATVAASLRQRSAAAYTGVSPTDSVQELKERECRTRKKEEGGYVTECRRDLSSTDVETSLRWHGGRLDLAASAGRRVSARNVDGDRMWTSASAAVNLAERVTLVGSYTQSPANVLRQFPDRRTFALGVRLRPVGSRRAATSPVPVAPDRDAERVVVGAAAPDGTRALRVIARAERLELKGDMTDWQPLPMQRLGPGLWEVHLALPEGVYNYAIRADGGNWRAPAGAPVTDDGFGGEVAVLVVETAAGAVARGSGAGGGSASQ